MPAKQRGFTLIELMIVIAIIGVLASIAIPQYQDYVIRSKVTEGLNLVQPVETAVAEIYESLGKIPATGNASGGNSFGLPAASSIAGSYVSSISVQGGSGIITIIYNAAAGVAAGANVLVLTPNTGPGVIAWACGYAIVAANGRKVGGPGSGTKVLAKYLPGNCRD